MTNGKSHHDFSRGPSPLPGENRRAGDEPARVRASTTPGREARNNWLDPSCKRGGRHSAIARNLYSWSSYKSWAEKVRSDWDSEK